MRARSWAMRDAFPDLLKGVKVREEAGDYIDIAELEKPDIMPRPLESDLKGDNEKTSNRIADGEPVPSAPESANQAGDAQEPGNSPVDLEQKIDTIHRKELFRLWTEAKIPVADVSAWCLDRGIKSTADLTIAQANELEMWIKKGGRD